MKRKLISVFMTVIMGCTLLAGCGSSGDSTGTSSGESTVAMENNEDAETETKEADTKEADTDGDQTLTVWAWDKSFNIYSMEEAEKVYQKDHPGFQLEIVEVGWDDMQTKLSTIVGSGNYDQLPDILLMQDFAYQKYCITYPDLFQDLTDCGIDFSQFAEGKLNASVVGGKNYGVPFDNGTEIAAYRTDILEQAGYTVEDLTDIDWDRFIEIGKDVFSKTGYSLCSVQAASSDLIYQMLQSAGVSTWNEDDTPNLVGNDVLKQCVGIYKTMFEEGVMAITNSWDEYIATFTSGKSCGVINGCWIMASIQSAKDTSGLWQITNLPSLPGVEGATNYSNQGGSTWAITSNCSDFDLAVDFLKETFAGSVELYETILPGAGALSTWIPASESSVYSEPQEFYGGQEVFSLLTDFAEKTPSVNLGVYYTEANTALATLLANVVAGSDIDDELKIAQETVEFSMQ